MPISTPHIVTRSSSERGRSAERIPIGIEIISQSTAPPKTSDAVTGAACSTSCVTSWRFVNERPSDCCRTSRSRKRPYCTSTGRSVPRKCCARAMHSGVARCPQVWRAGSAGMTKKITNVTSVTAMKSTTAQSNRRMM